MGLKETPLNAEKAAVRALMRACSGASKRLSACVTAGAVVYYQYPKKAARARSGDTTTFTTDSDLTMTAAVGDEGALDGEAVNDKSFSQDR